jgi:hypothetical protein
MDSRQLPPISFTDGSITIRDDMSANPYQCRCGYDARGQKDLDEHVEAMVIAGDERDHG